MFEYPLMQPHTKQWMIGLILRLLGPGLGGVRCWVFHSATGTAKRNFRELRLLFFRAVSGDVNFFVMVHPLLTIGDQLG